jgi:hypothetical protein
MKRLLYILFFVLLAASAQASNVTCLPDSISDTWSVIYNGKEILPININGTKNYMIDSIADDAKIVVDYYPSQECAKCQSRLQFRDDNGKMLATIEKEGFGDGDPFKIPGKQFRQLIHNHKIYLFFSANPNGWGRWLLLGVVKTK